MLFQPIILVLEHDFKSDTAADKLVLNVDETNTSWIAYNSNGTVKSGGSTFEFNVVNNFDYHQKISLAFSTVVLMGTWRYH